jgi:hypothetical protein
MYRNVNLDAHLAALLFLGSAGLLLLLVIAILLLAFWRRQWLRYAVTALAVLLVGYAMLLLAFSAFSRERTLARGEEKYFCEFDCHLAYSVQDVERVKSIGDVSANGEFYIVRLRTRFDENTIAPWRPREVPLTPDALDFVMTDDHGQVSRPSAAAQKAFDANHPNPHSTLDPLRPGESYETILIFDVPGNTRSPRLLASFGVFPTQLLIGDESSLLHKKTYFGL